MTSFSIQHESFYDILSAVCQLQTLCGAVSDSFKIKVPMVLFVNLLQMFSINGDRERVKSQTFSLFYFCLHRFDFLSFLLLYVLLYSCSLSPARLVFLSRLKAQCFPNVLLHNKITSEILLCASLRKYLYITAN